MSVKQVQAIVNGQTYTLTFNSNTGKYEATVTAPNKSSYSQSGQNFCYQIACQKETVRICFATIIGYANGFCCEFNYIF
jgi:hypothetical protein